MARTLETIYNQIINEKETYDILNTLTPISDNYQDLLSNLTSQSRVAVWRLWVYVVALAIWFHEKIFDSHRDEVEQMITNNQLGQTRWYVKKALEFQYGFNLSWDGDKYVYLNEDPESLKVSQSSAVDTGSVVLVKVAKYVDPSTPETSELEQLSTSEDSAFTSYINTIKPAGISTQVINSVADNMTIVLNIMYDPLLLTANGELIEDSTINDYVAGDQPAEKVFDSFLRGLPFDSKFRIVEMVDAIQSAEGIENVVVVSCSAYSGSNTPTDILAEYDQQYTTYSGYFRPSDTVISTFNYYEHS